MEKIKLLKPDLILIDLHMPGMDGLELIKIIREDKYELNIIILSGYSDFDYAIKAIKYDVDAYLLKPVNRDELINNIKNIQNKATRKGLLSLYSLQSIDNLKKQLLIDIMCGKITYASSFHITHHLNLSFDAFKLIMIIPNMGIGIDRLQHYYMKLLENFENDIFTYERNIYILIKGKNAIIKLKSIYEKLKIDNSNIVIVISNTVFKIAHISNIYNQVKLAFTNKFFYLTKDNIIFCQDYINTKESDMTFDITSYYKQLYGIITLGKTKDIAGSLDKFEKILRGSHEPPSQVIQTITSIYLQIKLSLTKEYSSISSHLKSDNIVINDIYNMQTLSNIIEYFVVYYNNISKIISQTNSSYIIEKVIYYISNNYTNSLKLENIASIFGYNSAYLGKLIKLKTSKSFNQYLTYIRIMHAKQMLKKDDIKIGDIAIFCGFKDIHCFSKLFKKNVGISPNKYRNEDGL